MSDRYASYAELAARETEGIHYRICLIERASPVVIVAPHGGEIEPGTSQIATSIAADRFSLYRFEGLTPGRPHSDLHITSDRFDEPRGRHVVETSDIAVAVHGRKHRDDDPRAVWLGGLDTNLRDAIGDVLKLAGFEVQPTGHPLPGTNKANICNGGRSGAGVQLELPMVLRDALVRDHVRLEVFAAAVRGAIERHLAAVG